MTPDERIAILKAALREIILKAGRCDLGCAYACSPLADIAQDALDAVTTPAVS